MTALDVPSPIDFHDLAQARAWVDRTVAARPWRPQFFQAFAAALNAAFEHPFTVLKLGSAPGHLAGHVLAQCRVKSYTALDFPPAMHLLARDNIGPAAGRIRFVERDFREPQWSQGLGPIDAVITMQAAHETRHKRHLPTLLRQVHGIIRDDGLLLYCDHYAEPGSAKHADLYQAADEQPDTLSRAGFDDVTLLLDQGGMALYRARRPATPVSRPRTG